MPFSFAYICWNTVDNIMSFWYTTQWFGILTLIDSVPNKVIIILLTVFSVLYISWCVYIHTCVQAHACTHAHTHTHSGILLSHKKGEWNLAICDNMDGPGGQCASETS